MLVRTWSRLHRIEVVQRLRSLVTAAASAPPSPEVASAPTEPLRRPRILDALPATLTLLLSSMCGLLASCACTRRQREGCRRMLRTPAGAAHRVAPPGDCGTPCCEMRRHNKTGQARHAASTQLASCSARTASARFFSAAVSAAVARPASIPSAARAPSFRMTPSWWSSSGARPPLGVHSCGRGAALGGAALGASRSPQLPAAELPAGASLPARAALPTPHLATELAVGRHEPGVIDALAVGRPALAALVHVLARVGQIQLLVPLIERQLHLVHLEHSTAQHSTAAAHGQPKRGSNGACARTLAVQTSRAHYRAERAGQRQRRRRWRRRRDAPSRTRA